MGDLVLVIDNDVIKRGIIRDCPVVIDVEDKITALKEPVDKEHIIKLIFRTLDSTIGECSNCATSYHNKTPRTEEVKQRYQDYVSLLSVITGKSIDSAKTGVRWNIPRYIAKMSKPLPYFMKYASPYYASMTKFNKAQSLMNRLCRDLEHWEKKEFKFRKISKDFDYTIMVAPYIPVNQETYDKIDKVFCDYCREVEDIKKFAHKCKNYDEFKDWFKLNYPGRPRELFENWEPNWNFYYDKYRKICKEICPDKQELANIAVHLCYVKYPSRSKRFIWKVAEDGILLNILCKKIVLPKKDDNGEYTYLGKKYSMVEVYNSAE